MTQATRGATPSTLNQQLLSSPAVRASIDAIVGELDARKAHITGVRPADPELKPNYDELIKRAGESRGRALMMPYVGSGIGSGIFVELADGSVKYDLTNGIGPAFFGHSDSDLARVALESSTADLVMQGHLQMNVDTVEFTELIVKEASRNSRLRHCFLSTSGAMANESALKIVMQKHSPASRIIAFQDCFMGRSLAMSLIGDNPEFREGLPTVMDVDYMPFFSESMAERMGGVNRFIDMSIMHLDSYTQRYPRQHAAFVMELVQGEGGYNTAPREYFKAMMEYCRGKDIAVWIDEIQTFGRTPEMFCYDTLELGEYVDVVTIGKMSQACATLFTPDYMPRGPLLSGTFLGSTAAVNVGRRMLERLREGGYYGQDGIIARHHDAFVEQVKALAAKHPGAFPASDKVLRPWGGSGGMMRFTPFAGKKDMIIKFCKTLFDEGALAIWCGHDPYHARLLPPLGCMDIGEWPKVFQVIERALVKTAG